MPSNPAGASPPLDNINARLRAAVAAKRANQPPPPVPSPPPVLPPSPRPTIDLSGIIERVVVINLRRRLDRLKAFYARLPTDWPYPVPLRLEAHDGHDMPSGWGGGRGAWGCMESHRQAMREAVADGVGTLLVLEDDAEPRAGFVGASQSFWASLPDDWQMGWLGNQDHGPAPKVNQYVTRPAKPHRMHAYTLRGEAIALALARLESLDGELAAVTGKLHHCDHRLGEWSARNLRTYAASPTLFHQGENTSDICGKTFGRRF